MKRLDRRIFLCQTAMVAGGVLLNLNGLIARSAWDTPGGSRARRGRNAAGYGPLSPTASENTGETILALPAGFQYNVIGSAGSTMSDGRLTPGSHDGMAAFEFNGLIYLVRNHELQGGLETSMADGEQPYDIRATGGTTTLIVDPVKRLLYADFVSLSGTVRNCAGGPTPWGTWVSCEETIVGPTSTTFWTQPHGYNFEVSTAVLGETPPVPLRAMGRFSHEAVAVDPESGFAYETEDASPAGFYRFTPHAPSHLAAGGRLQMLAIKHHPSYDTRRGQVVGQSLLGVWVDIDHPDPDLQGGAPSVGAQGRARGAALFTRLEGAWYRKGRIIFVSTDGGDMAKGQIWEYRPDGYLTLLFESPSGDILDMPDNVVASPRGGLVLCEDGPGRDYLRGLSREGELFDFAYNAAGDQEFAGATYSPDGQTLFVNVQGLGKTCAIWPREGYAWEDGAL